jgi:hypothetical protein
VRGKLKPASGAKRLNSQQLWIRKVQVSPYKVRYALFVVKPQILGIELDWIFKKLSYQSCDLRALRAGQSHMGEEWMALKGFHHSNNAIMATNPQVISLGHIMSEHHS